MSLPKIIQEDLVNMGVTGLPDTPNLTTKEMQRKFDELSLDVLIPKFNALVDALVATTASAEIGVVAPEGRTGENLQALLDSLNNVLTACEKAKHEHENKESLDSLTDAICTSINNIVALLDGITSITNKVTGAANEIPTGKAIADYVQVMGGGDMVKSIYDPDDDGVVKTADKALDSETLGGQLPSYYQPVSDEMLETLDKTVVGAINELKVAIENAKVDTYTTMEQVNASTDPEVPVGAGAVKELSDNLGGLSFTYDESTQKYGYIAEVEGADTFFPFKGCDINDFTISGLNPYGDYTSGSGSWVAQKDMIIAVYSYSKISYSLKIGGVSKSFSAIYYYNTADLRVYGGVYKVLKGQTVAMANLRYFAVTFE